MKFPEQIRDNFGNLREKSFEIVLTGLFAEQGIVKLLSKEEVVEEEEEDQWVWEEFDPNEGKEDVKDEVHVSDVFVFFRKQSGIFLDFFRKFTGENPECFRNFSRTFPKQIGHFVWTFQEISWTYPGNFLDIF